MRTTTAGRATAAWNSRFWRTEAGGLSWAPVDGPPGPVAARTAAGCRASKAAGIGRDSSRGRLRRGPLAGGLPLPSHRLCDEATLALGCLSGGEESGRPVGGDRRLDAVDVRLVLFRNEPAQRTGFEELFCRGCPTRCAVLGFADRLTPSAVRLRLPKAGPVTSGPPVAPERQRPCTAPTVLSFRQAPRPLCGRAPSPLASTA